MSDNEDPEVVADLKLRAYTERDRSRSGADYHWTNPKIVGAWRCRVPKCPERVGVTQDAMDALAMWNRERARRGEDPIATGDVMYCDGCVAHMRATAPDRRRKQVDSMAEIIRQLKEGARHIRYTAKDGQRIVDEPAALEQLRKWGHPDVKGLEQALAERRQSGKGRKEKI